MGSGIGVSAIGKSKKNKNVSMDLGSHKLARERNPYLTNCNTTN